jgi:hypothetical protein
MAHAAFISHSSKDKAVADVTCAFLESHGINCWMASRDIRPGSKWGASIVKAIRASRIMILIFSRHANSSPQIMREVERAVNAGVVLIPVRIENILPDDNLEYFLNAEHWLDAFPGAPENYLGALVHAVNDILKIPATIIGEPALEDAADKVFEHPGTSGAQFKLEKRSVEHGTFPQQERRRPSEPIKKSWLVPAGIVFLLVLILGGAGWYVETNKRTDESSQKENNGEADKSAVDDADAQLAAEQRAKDDAKAAADQKAKDDAVMAAAEQKAQDDAAKTAADQKAKDDAAKAAADQKTQDEAAMAAAQQKAQEDAATAAADQKAKDDAAKAAVEQKAQDDAAKAAADQKAKDDAAKAAVEQKAKDDAGKAAAEQKAQDDAAIAAAEQKAKDEAAKAAAEQKAQDEATLAAAVQKAQDDGAKAATEQKAKDDAAKLAAEEKARDDAAKLAAEQKAKDDAAKAAAALAYPQDGQSWVNSLGMKFVPAGTSGVLFDVWDTRVEDYQAFVKASGNEWPKPDFVQEPDHPAVNVSWNDAKAFCEWLTTTERQEGKLGPNQSYRLPTDAEWSRAVGLKESAEGTPDSKNGKIPDIYPWGTQWPPPQGSGNYADKAFQPKYPKEPAIEGYNDGYANTSPVGHFKANSYGLYDMGGDVWQWCEDWLDDKQQWRVLRGGSWDLSFPGLLLSSSRLSYAPDSRNDFYGFRCVVETSLISGNQ